MTNAEDTRVEQELRANAGHSRAEQKRRTRRRLIDATMDVMANDGLSGTTMGKVARRAGLSQGIVNFHFESKEQLLGQTLTALAEEHAAACERAWSEAGDDPARRLEATVRALLDPALAENNRLDCWFAYWGDAYARGIYRKIGCEAEKKTAAAIEALCGELLEPSGQPEEDRRRRREIASTLNAMIRGHWLMTLLCPEEVDLERGAEACLTYLRGVFGVAFETAARRTPEAPSPPGMLR